MTVVDRLAELVDAVAAARGRAAIAFDGPDAAGKTTLADSVAAATSGSVCRASVDGFHAPAAVRTRRGGFSAEGYYRDSFDYTALTDRLLAPFRAGASTVETQVFDYQHDETRRTVVRVDPLCALLFDGVFLLRPEIRKFWALSVYVHASEEQTLERAVRRDVTLFGSEDAVIERYRRRYLPGQALYRREARPLDVADVVIDKEKPSSPVILKWDVPPA